MSGKLPNSIVIAVLLLAACGSDTPVVDSGGPRDSAPTESAPHDSAPSDGAPGPEAAPGPDAAPRPDSGPADSGPADSGAADQSVGATDFSKPGPRAVSESRASLAVSGCTLDYTLYTPAGGGSAPLVVLGHGFSRTAANVADVAKHVASFGVRVVTPTYCGADHPKNAKDAVALSQSLAAGAKVIHAGHSAGGLSAVLAATQDSATIAVLGLDLTDAADAALKAAPGLTIPGLGLVGEPGTCNANGNGRAVFKAMSSFELIRVVNGTHCDFEAPSGVLCALFCGGGDPTRAALARTLAAAFIAWRAGVDSSGEQWIAASGSERARLTQSGVIQSVP